MYCMTVSYPKSEDGHFDMDYYIGNHLPLCHELFDSHGLKAVVLRSAQGKGPGRDDVNYASVDLVFGSVEDLQAALSAGGQQVTADIPNYTNVKPTMTFGDISIEL